MGLKHWIGAAAVAAFVGVGAFVFLGAGRPRPRIPPSCCSTAAARPPRTSAGRSPLVNFWATSCTTCVAEMPQIVSTYGKYRDRGFETLAVAMSYDPPSYVVNFAQTRQLPFKVAIDNTGTVAKAWGDVRLTPSTFIVNKRGEIVKSYVGAPDFAELHQLIERLLAET